MNDRSWTEHFRVLSPVLLLVLNILAGVLIANQNDLKKQVEKIDNKIFSHLTNDEIHSPRAMFVDKQNFDLYQKMRDKQMDDMSSCVLEIKGMIRELQKRK